MKAFLAALALAAGLLSGGASLADLPADPPFYPTGNTSLAVTNVSASVALPGDGGSLMVCNTGASTAYVNLGVSGVVATTTSFPVQSSQCAGINSAGSNTVAAVTASGSTTLTVSSGNGVPWSSFGGGAGGIIGAVTQSGQWTVYPADAVNFNNTVLSNGTVTNGLFSSGTVVNPTTSQVLLGPIDMTGAQSVELTQTYTSGNGVTVQVQESASASGPWSSVIGIINGGTGGNSTTTNFPSAANGSFKASPSGRYVQVVAAVGGTETLSISGYLRAGPASTQLAFPAVWAGAAATQLNGATSNFGVVQLATTGAKYLVVVPNSVPELTWQFSTNGTAITTNTTTTLQGAQAASVRNYLDGISCDNSGTGAATELQILDGSTVIYDGFIGAASATLSPHWAVPFPTPLRGTAATAISLKTITTGAALFCSAQGHAAY